MARKEEEKAKVSSSEIKRLERILDKIELEEQALIDEFDLNAERILGRDLIERLKNTTSFEKKEDAEHFLKSRTIRNSKGQKIEAPYSGILTSVHRSFITDPAVKKEYEEKLRTWFASKTNELLPLLRNANTAQIVNAQLPRAYAIASLGLTSFHQLPNIRLRDVQKLAGIAISNGDIAELGTGEGKTLSAVLPVYLQALRGKGVHVATSNSYLSRRDYDEVRPIFEGLGLSCGFVPENVEDLARSEGINYEQASYEQKQVLQKKYIKTKKDAYQKDITYGSNSSFAFDYLRDSQITKREDMIQREENPGFALIDEIDDALIDAAQCPYILSGNACIYKKGMKLYDLSLALNRPYREVQMKAHEAGITVNPEEKLDYEKASFLASVLYSQDLLPDQNVYQEKIQTYFERQIKDKVFTVRDDMFNGRPTVSAEDLYEVLIDDSKKLSFPNKQIETMLNEEIERIRKNYDIILNPNKKKYKINDSCYEKFLRTFYLSFYVPGITRQNQQRILQDPNYKAGIDYNVYNGVLRFTGTGVLRIIEDKNHPEFSTEYQKFVSAVHPDTAGILHYFDKALDANLLMSSPRDYIVQNGMVRLVKGSRVQENSTYSEGLHQAIEFKEHISPERRTSINHSISSITQKDFYARYDAFAGMTGTSSRELFARVFGKNTVSIPRSAFYNFFSSRVRKAKKTSREPVEVEKRETSYATSDEDKIGLIIDSIRKSRETNPMQPVLLVVANPKEMEKLHLALQLAGITHKMLDANTDKSKEAEIIARAGRPGAVTITTEMAGRGTDIRLGGDRDTIIDLATTRQINLLEQKKVLKSPITTEQREEVRKAVEMLIDNHDRQVASNERKLWSKQEQAQLRQQFEQANIGLKVISSGFFNVERVDRQLEGRTGRNGFSGICERFVSPSDIEYLGLGDIKPGVSVREFFSKMPKDKNERCILDSKNRRIIEEKISAVQRNNESIISENIIYTQELSKLTSSLVEKCRNRRRQIICDKVDLSLEIQSMIEMTVDNLLMSYVIDKNITPDNLLASLASSKVKVELDAFALEVKDILGVCIDVESIRKNNTNLLELRNALIETVLNNHEKEKRNDPNGQLTKDKEALLFANSYAIENLPTILDSSVMKKSLTAMSMGMEGLADYSAQMEFDHRYKSMQLAASKVAIKQLLGLPLTKEEKKYLDYKKEEIFGLNVARDNNESEFQLIDSLSTENDATLVERFRELSRPLTKTAEEEKEKIDKKASKLLKKDSTRDVAGLYSNLSIRPMQFVSSLSKTSSGRLVIVQKPLTLESIPKQNGPSLS